MNNNIFENARFGDKFKDNDGKEYIYHYAEQHNSSDKVWTYHYLMREPVVVYDSKSRGSLYAGYEAYVNIDGYGIPSHLKYSTLKSLLDSPNKGILIVEKCIDENKEDLINELETSKMQYVSQISLLQSRCDKLKKELKNKNTKIAQYELLKADVDRDILFYTKTGNFGVGYKPKDTTNFINPNCLCFRDMTGYLMFDGIESWCYADEMLNKK